MTPKEQEQKLSNEKEIKPIFQIDVPENILIVRLKNIKEHHILGLLFNEKQVIYSYGSENGKPIFFSELYNPKLHDIVKCKLEPYFFDDIKIGEIFISNSIYGTDIRVRKPIDEDYDDNEYTTKDKISYRSRIDRIDPYCIKATEENGISIIEDGCAVLIHGLLENRFNYKVVPIN